MDDLWVHIRIYLWHFQIGPSGFKCFRNQYAEREIRRQRWYEIDKWIEIYILRPFIY